MNKKFEGKHGGGHGNFAHKDRKPGFSRDKPKGMGFKEGGFREFINPDEKSLGEITAAVKGNRYSVSGVVDRVVQTGGPTVFYISDGTGTLPLKSFEGAGVRANPDIDVGDVVKAVVKIEEYNDELEGEVEKISKLSDSEKVDFAKKVEKLERERAKVEAPEFLVEDPILHKLKDRFVKAATEIRLAIIQNRPIIIRHHNDTDGYSSGFALERAILPLIAKQHSSVKAAWEFYTRSPCAAPMYELDDSIRDTAHSLANVAKFSNKLPLVLIVDTGSGQESLLGIQQGRVHGLQFIVVDHHRFEEDVTSKETVVHINPFLVGEDGAKFSAGMLCTELARFINPVENIVQIPAMAGMADRVDNPKTMEAYLKLAAKKGYTKELLHDISMVIDFVSSKLRFMEAREYIEVLFGEPREKQKALVELLMPQLKVMREKGLAIARIAARTEKAGETTLQFLEIENTFPRGFYPRPGICTELIHDDLQKAKKLNRVVTLGVLADGVTMRATDEANFSVQDLIVYLNKVIPEAFVEGGGHKNAGSIKFMPGKQKEVIEHIRDFVEKR